jgi:hypothetical protein
MQGRSRPWGPPEAFLEHLRAALDPVPPDDLVILGGFCDGYPPLEEELGLSRRAVTELLAQGRHFVVVTKGLTVRRDADLLRQDPRCRVQVSLSVVDDDIGVQLDPGVPPPSARLRLLRELRAAGVATIVNALPWIPGVTDTAAIIASVPPDVPIEFSPLACGPFRDSITIMGIRLSREHINTAYLAEYDRFGHIENTSWIRPKPPPDENHPLYRLPRLGRSAASAPVAAAAG